LERPTKTIADIITTVMANYSCICSICT